MNISNYALMLEKKAYGYLQINEAADMQTADGLAKLMSGQNGGAYQNQWDQLVSDYESKKGAAGTYKVMIKHDNTKDMIFVEYTIGADKKPVKGSIKLATDAAAGAPSSAIVSDAAAVEAKMIKFSEDIQKCFATNGAGETGGDMFADYLGDWNDDDTGAAAYFKSWADRQIYSTLWKIKAEVEKFTDEYQKNISLENINNVHKAIGAIHGKMIGSWDASDTVAWKIAKTDGTFKPYKVDTDIG
jgi:hypothetical protein